MTVFAITGHRPCKLGGYTEETDEALRRLFRWFFTHNRPDGIIAGMAIGTDLAAAEVAIEMGIPVVAAVPYEEQDSLWSDHQRARYRRILSQCAAVQIMGTYMDGKWIFHARNRWMVENCTHVVAVWNGGPKGGTAQTLKYAAPLRPHWNLYETYKNV